MDNRIVKLIKNPFRLFMTLGHRGYFNWMSDERYLRTAYRISMGWKKRLNLSDPRTYNEKLQWLKIYNRNPAYTVMVDKYAVKQYVASTIGDKYIIPTLGVWDSPEDIDWDVLPNQFVLKCTHDSGGLVLCKDKSKLNIRLTSNKLKQCLKHNYYWGSREWPYKNVKPQIIAEEYMVDESGSGLKDYKFFCFDGVPMAMFIASDRYKSGEETKFDFFDMDFNHLPFTNGHPNSDEPISKPQGFEEMKSIAAQLSKDIPHVRVDLYSINGNIYFGEMTFFHWSGFCPFVPEEWDYTFGDWISLPHK